MYVITIYLLILAAMFAIPICVWLILSYLIHRNAAITDMEIQRIL